jgi:5-methyltetrahydrofolate--homocysteine methyltransferase
MSREEEIRQELFDHTLNGHAPEVKALTEEGLKLGMDPMDILFKALIPSLVIGTVKGDIHDIGKNLVVIMLEGAGFEVVDLGVNCPPEKFVEAVRTNEPHIVGFSAFLTTTMPMFKVNIQALEKAGLRDKVVVMVGGAPVTEEYAKLAGADHYAPDASFATRMAKQVVGAAQAAENAALTQAVELIDKTLRKG